MEFNGTVRRRLKITACVAAGMLGAAGTPALAVRDVDILPINSGSTDKWSWGAGAGWSFVPGANPSQELDFQFNIAPGGGYTNTSINDLTNVEANILGFYGAGSGTVGVPTPPGTTTVNVTGNALTLTKDPITNATAVVNLTAKGSGLTFNVGTPLNLQTTVTFQGNGTANFNFTGAVTANANYIYKTDWSALTLSGPIDLGTGGGFNVEAGKLAVPNVVTASGAGAGSVFINGGQLILAGDNTFSGTVNLNSGELDLNNPAPTSTASPVGTGGLYLNGGTLDQISPGSVVLATNNVQHWGLGFTFAGSNPLDLGTGAVTLAPSGNSTVTANGYPLTVRGPIGDAGLAVSLTKKGTGLLVLSGNNTYTGGTIISMGTVEFTSPAAVAGTGRSITIKGNTTKGGAAAAGYAIDQAFINRIATASIGAAALGADSSNNLDFSSAGANLAQVSIGSLGNHTYSGAITPYGNTYLLGGGSTDRVNGSLTLASTLRDLVPGTAYNVTVQQGINGLNDYAGLWYGAGTIGAVILANNNSYSGTTLIGNDAILQVGNGGTTGSLGSTAAPITSYGILAIDRSDAYAIPNPISGGMLVQAGTGRTTLSGTNSFGRAVVLAGTLAIAGQSTMGSIEFNGSGTVDLGGKNQSVYDLELGGNTTSYTGVLRNGSLSVTGTYGEGLTAFNTGGTTAAVDLSGLSKFTCTQLYSEIDFGNGTANKSTPAPTVDITLSATSNSLTTTTCRIGSNSPDATTSNPLTAVHLGAANSIDVTYLAIGGYLQSGALDFQSGLTAPSLAIRGTAGGDVAADVIYVGCNSNQNGSPSIGTLDLSAGTVDALTQRLRVAGYTGPGVVGATGTVNMAAGTLYAGQLDLGQVSSTGAVPAPINATLNQSGGSVLAGTVTLGGVSDTSTPRFTATYNLGTSATPATLLAQTITVGPGTFDPASRETINWANGTISNYDPAGFPVSTSTAGATLTPTDLTISGATGGGAGGVPAATLTINLAAGGTHTLLAQTGHTVTVAGTALLTGPGALTKSGGGTLAILGSNDYAGGTSIAGGMLLANGANSLGTGAILVGDRAGGSAFSAKLAGTGLVTAPVTVYPGSTISAGDGSSVPGKLTLSSAAGNMLVDGSTYLWKINDAGKAIDGSGSGSGVAGNPVGWDQIAFNSLSVGSGTGVDVVLTASSPNGQLANFVAVQTYRWPILMVPGSGAALAANFHLDPAAVAVFDANNSVPPAGNFWISGDATDVYVNYAPAPEPTSLGMLGAGASAVLLRRRRNVRR